LVLLDPLFELNAPGILSIKLGSFPFKLLGMNGFRLATCSMMLEPVPLLLAVDSGLFATTPLEDEEDSNVLTPFSDVPADRWSRLATWLVDSRDDSA
jgi:hypothetical protein